MGGTGSLARIANLLTKLARRLASALANLPHSTADTLPNSAERLPRGLLKAPKRLPRGLAKATERLPRIACDLTYGPTGTKRLACGIRQPTNSLACRSTRPQGLFAELSDVANCVVECVNEPFENLGISIEGSERAIENVVEVLQAHLQPRFSLNTLDVHLDFAQADMNARDHLEKVREFRSEREMGF